MRHSQLHLPTELLREIIMIVLVEYLDDIIPDVSSIRNFRLDDSIIPDEVNLTFQGTKQLAKQQIERDGFVVTTEASVGTLLMRYKLDNGVPQEMASCHTARVEGFMIEGHVPVADIRRLLADRPDAIGLAVPGMPFGSPGMGPEDQREAYDVLLIRRVGSAEVYSRYEARS